ncbi:hypothetical protein [Niallia sp. Krafla_26]|uniref:hypothetical protein n=1 Tax=Niallia sp. Krafla_26 TaxID=3064703 RepID=UPI003D17E885
MNNNETPLLPFITPTKSYKIWQLNEISEHNNIGVYVFWDKYVIDNDKDIKRYDYDFNDSPLYIGRADNLGKRVLNHIKGNTHTEPYSCYFHTVDLYELEDAKTMKNDHPNYAAFTEIEKLQKIMKSNNGLNEKAITDFYELYFILLRLPFFNERSSYFTAEVFKTYTYRARYLNQHRRVWAKTEVVNPGGPTVEEFLQSNGINIDLWYPLDEFINKVISKWYLKDQNKKKYLSLIINDQIANGDFPTEVITGDLSKGTLKVAREYVIFYDHLLNKEQFKQKYEENIGKW